MLTDEEANALNYKVAVKMGWVRHVLTDRWFTPKRHHPEGSAYYVIPLPDFCRDNMAVGYLLDYVEREAIPFRLDGSDEAGPYLGYTIHLDSSRRGFAFMPKVGEAIVRAILAQEEQEK